MLINRNQKFQWLICGHTVPLGYALLSATVRDKDGVIVQRLSPSDFVINDYDQGFFSIVGDNLSPEAATIQIYGQLPNTNRVIITKGELSPVAAVVESL